jgi:hypothetical protein
VIVAVVRLKPGSRNLCSACQSSVSTMKNIVCCEFAPYRPISVTPSTVEQRVGPSAPIGQFSGV